MERRRFRLTSFGFMLVHLGQMSTTRLKDFWR
jgi:hypothetical protein